MYAGRYHRCSQLRLRAVARATGQEPSIFNDGLLGVFGGVCSRCGKLCRVRCQSSAGSLTALLRDGVLITPNPSFCVVGDHA